MTAVEILFRYAVPPTERVNLALAATCEVYGMRRLQFDRVARTLRVEYDATRLNAASVARLVSQAGLEIAAPLPLAELQPVPGPVPAT